MPLPSPRLLREILERSLAIIPNEKVRGARIDPVDARTLTTSAQDFPNTRFSPIEDTSLAAPIIDKDLRRGTVQFNEELIKGLPEEQQSLILHLLLARRGEQDVSGYALRGRPALNPDGSTEIARIPRSEPDFLDHNLAVDPIGGTRKPTDNLSRFY